MKGVGEEGKRGVVVVYGGVGGVGVVYGGVKVVMVGYNIGGAMTVVQSCFINPTTPNISSLINPTRLNVTKQIKN